MGGDTKATTRRDSTPRSTLDTLGILHSSMLALSDALRGTAEALGAVLSQESPDYAIRGGQGGVERVTRVTQSNQVTQSSSGTDKITLNGLGKGVQGGNPLSDNVFRKSGRSLTPKRLLVLDLSKRLGCSVFQAEKSVQALVLAGWSLPRIRRQVDQATPGAPWDWLRQAQAADSMDPMPVEDPTGEDGQ